MEERISGWDMLVSGFWGTKVENVQWTVGVWRYIDIGRYFLVCS